MHALSGLSRFHRLLLAGAALVALTGALTPLQVAAQTAEVQAQIRAILEPRIQGGARIDAIRPSPVAGMFEIQIGGDVIYVNETGTFMFQGSLVELTTGRNITQERSGQLRADMEKAAMPMLWSAATLNDAVKLVKGNGSRKVVVFEDPYCGYCKKLRQSFEAMNDLTVYTFMTTGLSPDSPKKARDLWCSTERVKAYDDWMVRNKAPTVADKACADPVARVAGLARKLGVGPVPAVFFADGSKNLGYLPAPELDAKFATVKAIY